MKPSVRFFRHGGIYRSDVVIQTMVTWDGVPPPVGRPPIPVKGRDGRNCAPCSSASSAMSSGRLFLDRGARQQCPSPLHRQAHPKTVPGSGTMDLQRTANSVLTVCLSFRGKRNLLKEAFQQLWDYNSPAWAGKFLDEWCRQTMRSRIEPMKKIARSLRKHRELILNYFRAQKLLSSGVVEGLNNKAKVTMRKSYGFRTYRVLELALYHSLGKLPEPESTHDFF
jgi:hypothetical protein